MNPGILRNYSGREIPGFSFVYLNNIVVRLFCQVSRMRRVINEAVDRDRPGRRSFSYLRKNSLSRVIWSEVPI